MMLINVDSSSAFGGSGNNKYVGERREYDGRYPVMIVVIVVVVVVVNVRPMLVASAAICALVVIIGH